MMRVAFLAGSVLSAMTLGSNALAQSDSSQIYEPSFFEAYTPRTALDMVERVPGFTIEEGEERRGFAGAQGNVLIDGEPPASKAQEIEDILARIPASDVIRLELLSGRSAGGAQGVRINIVRRPSAGEGVWELSAERSEDGRIAPSGEAAWSGRVRDVAYAVSATFDVTRAPVRGVQVESDATGAIDEARWEWAPADEREGRVTGEVSSPLLGGEFSANVQFGRLESDERTLATLNDGAGVFVGSIFGEERERETVGELALALRHRLSGWRSDLGVVATRRRLDAAETGREFEADGSLDEAEQQSQRIDSGETILRLRAERSLSSSWRLELGAEAAFNTLQQRLSLAQDTGAGPAPVILPSANVRVEEERAETSVLIAGEPRPRWSVEIGAAYEISRLSQTGDATQEIELEYWKPSAQIARRIGESNQLRLRLYRDVSQLDFEDFVSAADINAAVINAGNPNLRPETSWRIEGSADWRFGEGALSLTAYHWWIEDALDLIPLGPPGDQLDAPGNIGEGRVSGFRGSLTLPLPLSSELRVDAALQHSEVTDPLTGEQRAISEFEEESVVVAFRQDLTNWAWGFEYEYEDEAPAYRLDRIEQERDANDFTLWIETTAYGALKLRAWAANLTDSTDERIRRDFTPDRLGAFERLEQRSRTEGVRFGIGASGVF